MRSRGLYRKANLAGEVVLPKQLSEGSDRREPSVEAKGRWPRQSDILRTCYTGPIGKITVPHDHRREETAT
jgi:hypothetical protein